MASSPGSDSTSYSSTLLGSELGQQGMASWNSIKRQFAESNLEWILSSAWPQTSFQWSLLMLNCRMGVSMEALGLSGLFTWKLPLWSSVSRLSTSWRLVVASPPATAAQHNVGWY